MTAHDAAVEAMAAALRERFPDELRWRDIRSRLAAEEVLAALVRSEAVRAGIAASLHGFNSLGECECGFPTELSPEVMRRHQADAIIASLVPPGDGE